MYVKRVFYDDLRNPNSFEKEIDLPSWEEIEELIDRLDGKTVTQITMDNGVEDNYFCVGGGNEGLYNVFISENENERIWNLINPAGSGNTYKLVTGGQEGEFEGRLCVTVDMVKHTAKYYYETGKICNNFQWEK